MDISVIIPTHNRSESLKRAIGSILQDTIESEYEIVVVDNNSSDDTKASVLIYESKVNYFFEPNTSFTRARHTGAENAQGDILLYIDDDVIVLPGSIDKIVETFNKYPECGVVAGKILPKYEVEPPEWCLACEDTFNGWSLYSPDVYPHLANGFQEVDFAAGPMMAVSKKVYDLVGGFPPDTLGVETNDGKGTFNKLYVGPGDSGLCKKTMDAGSKVYYDPQVSCYHVIPEMRFTVPFWISRMKGEAHQKAIVNRVFYKYSYFKLLLIRFKAVKARLRLEARLLEKLKRQSVHDNNEYVGLHTEELYLNYLTDYLTIDRILNKYSWLSEYLWNLGNNGVSNNEFDAVNNKLPDEYKNLYLKENMYPETGINSMDSFKKHIANFHFVEFVQKYIYPIRDILK
jgi:glucosyl-dolichyl phosphate glucuronosyltransferase